MIRIQIADVISPPLRAICDTGSQSNMINAQIVNRLHFPTQSCHIRFNGINGVSGRPHTRKITCKILPCKDDTLIAIMEFVIVPQVMDMWLPQSTLSEHLIPSQIRNALADPTALLPAPVDLLLGAGLWAIIIQDGCFTNEIGMAFQPSRLGWLIFGGGIQERQDLAAMNAGNEKEPQLDILLRRFWEIEEVSITRTRTKEQEQCEEIFMRTHRKLPNGRFQVNIPIRSDIQQLGSSRTIALHRFRQLEKRFQRDPELKEKYFNAINDLISAKQMQLVDRAPRGWCYHIPHHPVLKKFRIVNDASCRTDMGISLNEAQLIGEKLQDDLALLIMRFRCHPIAITSDIQKMYLQVQVNPEQWDLQRIFWRPSSGSEINEYWLTGVTFGMASAPHCAVRAMIQGAREGRSQYPMGAAAVEHDFYMDDCLTGASDETAAKQVCNEMDALLRSCGFVLSKWRSNCPNIVPRDEMDSLDDILELSELSDTTVLGLRWLPREDNLMFKFQAPPILESKQSTKRRLLSHIAQIFDPNGYIGPVVIVAKILMQKIWNAGIDWDELVPDAIYREWQQFQQRLPLVTEIRLPRWLGIGSTQKISLHGFADASSKAYGAVLYVRTETAECIKCILVASKSRVAPLKSITIPRLELCAALLLSELMQAFQMTAHLQTINPTLWSDSQIVLAWLKKDSATLKIFVNNRIQKIKCIMGEADWRYVKSVENPADLLSRGMNAAEIRESKMWWHGPEWLSRPTMHWPEGEEIMTLDTKKAVADELKGSLEDGSNRVRAAFKVLAAMNITLRDFNLLERASSAFELWRLTAYVLRFIFNLHHRQERKMYRRVGWLSNIEIEEAQEFWIREEQSIYYAKEIAAINSSGCKKIDSSSPIFAFNPKLDRHGILRLNGRLDRALLPAHQKNPALLPDVSPLAKLLIREAHQRKLHGGPREMAAYLRQKFWITNLRRAIRSSNSQCFACTRQKQQMTQQIMSELPSDRVLPCRPFRHSGVDYAGPYLLKARGGRCRILEKKYVAVFVCMVTKAVHLELVDSLTTNDFILAFLRFTSIRGACKRLWSDNGKNFEGAQTELKRMLRSWNEMDMANMLLEYGTEWRFITPAAPHQGGLWEAAVKSMKFHLRRVIGAHQLTDTAFRTVLAQTSAVMNSRPLSAQTETPDDLSFLTPAHFLIGEPIIQPFGANLQEIPDNKLKLYAQIQKISQSFWKAWKNDYLNELQQRPKWRRKQPSLKVGDLVVVKDENTPPTLWKTARVSEVYPGADGLVRNVKIKVANADWNKGTSELTRPVQKLCRLPLDDVEAETSRAQIVEAN